MKRQLNVGPRTYALAASGIADIRQWWSFRLETHASLRLSPRDTAAMPLLRSLQYHAFLDKVDHDNLVNAINTYKVRKK